MPPSSEVAAAPAYNTRSHRESASASPSSATSGVLIARMEGILESVADALSSGHELRLELMTHGSRRSRRMQELRFPGRSLSEGQKFARLLLMIQLSHDALVSGRILTKRQIYYQHQELFEKQRVVDDLVDDLAATLSVQRHDLNIVATAKGLCCGLLVIHLHDGTDIDASLGDTLGDADSASEEHFGRGVPVDPLGFGGRKRCYVPVTCVDELLENKSMRTGLADHHVPVVVLADFDPDGLNIFRCYWPDTESPALSSARPDGLGLRLLGIKSDHVIDLQASDSRPALTNQVSAFDFQSSSASTQHSDSAISTSGRYPAQTLSSRDRKHVRGTLSRVVERGGSDAEVVSLTRELQVMLMMGIKAEIQLLEDSGDLTQWLENNLTRLLSP
ncbi:hypothetical protein ACCO45_007769 [Purpureocillium lilacinum]|uniref:Uncharacterized protein n=1 Tax=Purpureocillium lilacinum TaxID=33203 RepID=A0ACC4DP33_PURLI